MFFIAENKKLVKCCFYINVIGKDLKHKRKIECNIPKEYKLLAIEYTERGLEWYLGKKIAYDTWNYRKYNEKNPDEFSVDYEYPGLDANKRRGKELLFGISTANYKLLQEEIWSKDGKNKICTFKRKRKRGLGNYGDVWTVKNKDIFIGVSSVSYSNDKLKKIDLRNEREPVTLSVQMP